MTDELIIDNQTGEIIEKQGRAYYAAAINGLVSGMVEAIIETGRLLIEAKASLDHGEFEAMIENDLPFSPPTARRFMTVAKHPILSNRTHVYDLPPSWGTLYEIAQLPETEIIARLESGELNPETQRKEVIAWRGGRNLDPLMTSQSNEWYTTSDIINLVLEAMVHIDLDPCSNSHEDPNVPAAHHFTKEDDGLNQEWFGRVYMNPPYGTAISHWIEKIVSEYEAGRVEQAIILVPARTDTRWFRRLEEYPRCFMWGRVRFNDHTNSAQFPTMLVALGIDIQHFKFVTKDIGTVYAVV